MFIIVKGNAVDGFSFVGPFTTVDEAIAYTEQIYVGDYVLAPLEPGE